MRIFREIAILFEIMIFLMCISQFFTNTPPTGVLVTVFRLPFQFMAQYILPVSLILTIIMIIGLWRQQITIRPINILLCCLLFMITILSSVYFLGIQFAEAKSYGMECALSGDKTADSKRKDESNRTQAYKAVDESKEACMKQLYVFFPEQQSANVCLIHINYGGWSVQGEETGAYLKKLCEKQGYAYVQLAGVGKEDGKLTDIVKSVRSGIAFIQTKYNFGRTYLVGSSAGGHIALISAFGDSRPDMYGDMNISVDGVIALYTPVDLEYQYQYFVEQHAARDILGKMGDVLYCRLFQGTSGTLGGETAKLQESFLGEYSSGNKLYQIAKVSNLVQNQKIPILFIQGDKDSQIGLEDKPQLYEVLDEKSIPYTVLNMPGVDHAYDMVLPEQTIAGKRSTREIRNWIKNMEQINEY